MKMSDVFHSELLPTHIRVKATPVRKSMDDGVAPHEAICKAANNHDTLTETNRLLNLECEELKGDVESLRECLNSMINAIDLIWIEQGFEQTQLDVLVNYRKSKELLDK